MAKLKFKKLANDGRGRFSLLVGAKIKELIDWYQISQIEVFQKEFNEWIQSIPKKNAYSLQNTYRLKEFWLDNKVQIWKHPMGSDTDPVLVYEICEEVSDG